MPIRRKDEGGAGRHGKDAPGATSSTGLAERELTIEVDESAGMVSALLLRPLNATRLLALAHGAGSGMRHPFLEATAGRLAARGIATLRYQFPYMERGSRRPDARPRLLATVRAALAAATAEAGDLPLLAGGKSMGGRMTSEALAAGGDAAVRALVFLGFPLHAPGRPSTGRADHLRDVRRPMLFVQGTRDALADPDLMRRVARELGAAATLLFVEGADHSFHVRGGGRDQAQVLDEIAAAIAEWTAEHAPAPAESR